MTLFKSLSLILNLFVNWCLTQVIIPPRAVLYLWPIKVVTEERGHFAWIVDHHRLRPCIAIHRKTSLIKSCDWTMRFTPLLGSCAVLCTSINHPNQQRALVNFYQLSPEYSQYTPHNSTFYLHTHHCNYRSWLYWFTSNETNNKSLYDLGKSS